VDSMMLKLSSGMMTSRSGVIGYPLPVSDH
jgi:hypothetical protein